MNGRPTTEFWILANTPGMAVVVFDQQLRFVYAAGDALTRQALVPQFMLGKQPIQVFPPELGYVLLDWFQDVLYRQRTRQEEYRHHGGWYSIRLGPGPQPGYGYAVIQHAPARLRSQRLMTAAQSAMSSDEFDIAMVKAVADKKQEDEPNWYRISIGIGSVILAFLSPIGGVCFGLWGVLSSAFAKPASIAGAFLSGAGVLVGLIQILS